MSSEVERVVARLSEPQREALIGAQPHVTLAHELWTPTTTDEFTLKRLNWMGLIWHFADGANPITPLGLAVRAHLTQEPTHDH